MRIRILSLLFTVLLGAGWFTPACAHEGHEHDILSVPQQYEPRFDTRTDAVELTGVLKAGVLWLYVSHYPDNSPWAGLKLALEQGGGSIAASAVDPGVYRVAAPTLATVGKHSVVVSVEGAGLDDLLNGELVVPASAHAASPVQPALLAGAVLLLVVVGVWLLRRRNSRKPVSA